MNDEKRIMSSEQLAKYWRRFDRLKTAVGVPHYPIPVMAAHCLHLAETFYGSKAELAKYLLDQHRQLKGRWTPEELADIEDTEREIAAMREEEIADLTRDYTPPDYDDLYWSDYQSLAIGLLDASKIGEKDFDEFFHDILVHRYKERVVVQDNGRELTIYQKKTEQDVLLETILGGEK